MKTVRISAKAYDQALRFCNKRRKEQGKKPIKKLPAGIGNDASSCPCSNTCEGLWVYHTHWYVAGGDGRKPGSPIKFTKEFDKKCGFYIEPVLPIRGLKSQRS